MKSIYLRNFLATALLVFFSFAIIGTAFFFLGRGYLINTTRERMDASADEVVKSALALSKEETLGSWNLRLTISPIAKVTSSHIFICDPDGIVLSCSDLTLHCTKHLGKQLDSSVVEAVSSGEEFDGMTTLMGFYSEQQYVVAKPINNGSETLGYVFVASSGINLSTSSQSFIAVVFAVAVAVMLISILMSLVYSKKMAEPLDELTLAARKFALGDFSVRVKRRERSDDEIGTLIESFNSMADSLEKSDTKRQEFIANVSHELRTPMTTIAGFADGILDGTIPREQEDKYLLKISDETRRLSRLVRSMLDLSQAESDAVDLTKRSCFDLSELLLQCLLSFESRANERHLDVDPQLPDDPIEVFAVRDSITQVIYNLTDNAMKFASPGSTVTIRLYKKEGKAYVSIKNIGEPIPEDDLPYIFDRFHKSDRSRSMDKDGVGLGLYLVKKILNGHGEEIAVSSRNGVTVFVFTLQLAPTKKK
jgi:signal transduction histidine kinase